MLREWLTRFRFLIASKPRHEIDEELQFHLDEQTQANIAAGMTPDEARRQAVIAFGGVEQAREQAHEQRPSYYLDTLARDSSFAIRGFRRNPLFSFTIVATLMLGIGATTAVFSVVDRILFRPLPYAQADRLVSLGLVQSLATQEFMAGGFYYDWRERQRPFEMLSAEGAAPMECDLTEHNPAQLSCAKAEASLLPMLGVSPTLGRNFLPEEDLPHGPKVALVSYNLWHTRYNLDPNILKRMIEIDGNQVQVVGVLPRSFELPSLHEADIIFPLAFDEVAQRKLNPGTPVRAFARLKPGVNIDQACAQLEPLFQSTSLTIPSEIRKDFHLRVRSLRDRQMQDVRSVAWLLLGTVLAVLLIACANVASLLLARGAVRARELAVRSALGASRSRLARQAITESMLLSLTGAMAGYAIAKCLLLLFLAIAPSSIPYLNQTQLDLRVICFTILLSLLCGLAFGIAPALQKPSGDMLSARTFRSASHATIRQSLVIAQIAASMVLLTGAMLLLRSFWNLRNQQLGIHTESTLTASITLGPQKYGTNQQALAFFQQLATHLRYGPGVSLVAVADSLPPAENHSRMRFSSIGRPGRPPKASESGGLITYRWVSPEYFRALDIPLLQGEGFNEKELNSSDHFVVISKSLADRLFPGKSPLGELLLLDESVSAGVGDIVKKSSQSTNSYKIVGVAADVKNGGLSGEDLPEYYRLRRDRAEDWNRSGVWGSSEFIVIRTAVPPKVIAPWIHSQVAAIDPTLPVDIETMQQRVSKLADQPRFQTFLVGFFAASGLVLAVIGLYGVISFIVTQRTQEIGVRMALGASKGSIFALVLGKSLRLILWGVALGVLTSLMVSRVLSSLLFGISPYDPITFVSVTLLLAFVALAATLIPARFATKVNPLEALRND